MEKYIGKNEYNTIQLMMSIDSEDFIHELPFAVKAQNIVAVNYMLSRICKDDLHLEITNLLSMTDDVLIAEVLLESVDFIVFRRMNSCLSRIKSLEVLEYLLNHEVAHFNVRYRSSECLRYATLVNDFERVMCFIVKKNYKNYSLTVRGMDTKNKCCVELAFDNGNDEMMKLFINSGVPYYDESFSEKLKKHLKILEAEICDEKTSARRMLLEIYYENDIEIHELPIGLRNKAYPECFGNNGLTRLKMSCLIRSVNQSTTI